MAEPKEPDFFGECRHAHLGIDWYLSHFDPTVRCNGEASPLYAVYPVFGDVAGSLAHTLPDAKLIYMVRDPIDQIRSMYLQVAHQSFAPSPFVVPKDEREREQNRIFSGARYAFQLRRYLEHYEKEKILIIVLEEFSANPVESMRKVFDFLELPALSDIQSIVSKKLNTGAEKNAAYNPAITNLLPERLFRLLVSARKIPTPLFRLSQRVFRWRGTPLQKPQLSSEQETMLTEWLADDVADFFKLIGRSIPEWRSYDATITR